MAKIICKIHGGNVADFTSPRLIADISKNAVSDPSHLRRLFFITERRTSVIVDVDFLNEHDLTDVSEIAIDINNENHITLLYEYLKPVCPICLEEYLKKVNIER